MVNKDKAANIAALNDAFRQQPLAILPRHASLNFEMYKKAQLIITIAPNQQI